MNQMNSLIVEGTIAGTPVKTDLPDGRAEAVFPIEVVRTYKNADGSKHEEISCFDVACWGKLAEHVADGTITKGRGIRVVGRLSQKRWECDSRQCAKIYIIAEHIEVKLCKGAEHGTVNQVHEAE